MFFLRSFIVLFFFSSAAFSLNEQDWQDDKEAVASMINIYRRHYIVQNISLSQQRQSGLIMTSKLVELQEAYTHFSNWGSFYSKLKETPYDVSKIMSLLEFPYSQRIIITAKIDSTENQSAKNIYLEIFQLINLVHNSIQPYFQQERDMNEVTDFEEAKRHSSDIEFQKYLKDKIETEKSRFWLPSRQRHSEAYNDKIDRLEIELSTFRRKIARQKVQETLVPDHLQSSAAQTQLDIKKERDQATSESTGIVSSEEEDAIRNKDAEDEIMTVESLPLIEAAPQTNENEIIPEVLAENLALQREFELQCKEDRRLKRTPKKRPPSAVATDTGASAEEKESIIDHPTLKRIFSLDVNLRYEEFLGFFRDLKLKMEERDGGITMWFNSELSKTFHRPHTQGNVVPYYDLRVAKRSLKLINIKLSF